MSDQCWRSCCTLCRMARKGNNIYQNIIFNFFSSLSIEALDHMHARTRRWCMADSTNNDDAWYWQIDVPTTPKATSMTHACICHILHRPPSTTTIPPLLYYCIVVPPPGKKRTIATRIDIPYAPSNNLKTRFIYYKLTQESRTNERKTEEQKK